MGFIGVGTMGRNDLESFMCSADTQVVAVCDVQRTVREAARQRVDAYYGKKVCTGYNNFWEITGRDDIDAVSSFAEYILILFHSQYSNHQVEFILRNVQERCSDFLSKEMEEIILNKDLYIQRLESEGDIQGKVLGEIF